MIRLAKPGRHEVQVQGQKTQNHPSWGDSFLPIPVGCVAPGHLYWRSQFPCPALLTPASLAFHHHLWTRHFIDTICKPCSHSQVCMLLSSLPFYRRGNRPRKVKWLAQGSTSTTWAQTRTSISFCQACDSKTKAFTPLLMLKCKQEWQSCLRSCSSQWGSNKKSKELHVQWPGVQEVHLCGTASLSFVQGCQKSDFVSSTETKACFHSRSSKVAHLNCLIEIWEELLRKCLHYLRELKFCLFLFVSDWVLWSHNPLLFQRLFWLLVSHKFCPVEAVFSASKCQLVHPGWVQMFSFGEWQHQDHWNYNWRGSRPS